MNEGLAAGATRLRLSQAQRRDWLRLIRSENVGPRTFRALLNRMGGAAAALAALPELSRKSGKPVRVAPLDEIEREMEAAERLGVAFVGMGEPDYPESLRAIADAPPLMAVRGQIATLRRPMVAIVGSRNASAVGLAMAERLAHGLGEAGYVVVSGLARGVDARAHRASLERGGVGVLAGGHRRIYPSEHVDLADALAGSGALVSEMPLDWEARGRDFPRRNRIVSGLSLGVIVVEAARRSGSLITARFAAEQGREVFAVPGSPLDPRAEGPNDLIADGATMCRSLDDVIRVLDAMRGRPQEDLFAEGAPLADSEPLWDELDLSDAAAAPRASLEFEFDEPAVVMAREAPRETSRGMDARAALLALLGPAPISVDELLRLAELPAPVARAALVELELDGRALRHDGGLVSLAT
ncbi:MAG: DNA-protecting protein DprA [Rhizobiales bacterium]|nr:DNA-protecting protein DprA [Hyphomicrobiales bacterium]